jgi:glycosyltransferase involved in cell wall biosynthesis
VRLIINTSTILIGGALQVAINLIKHSLTKSEYDIYYITNRNIYNIIPTEPQKTLIVERSPASFLAFKEKKVIKNYSDQINPDIIYSVGSPSYIDFGNVEVSRLTNPWIINSFKMQVYNIFPMTTRLSLKFKILVQRRYLKDKKYFITQTSDAKSKICVELGKKDSDVFVVENTYSSMFKKYLNKPFSRDYNDKINILIIGAPYPHKNLNLALKIAKQWKSTGDKKCYFTITYPTDQYEFSGFYQEIQKHNLGEYFVNKGKVSLEELIDIYHSGHILFLPTLLEVFSATLLEGFVFKLPIVTTDYSFNSSICGDAAAYLINPFDENEAISHFEKIISSESFREKLIGASQKLLLGMNTNDTYEKHFEILKEILNRD